MKEFKNKVKLRKLNIADKTILAKLLNNKNIWDNLRNRIPYPYEEKDAEMFIRLIEKDKFQRIFAIEFSKKFCGVIGLMLMQDVYEKSAELGYWIGEPFWGKGIATESVRLITDYGFNKLNLLRIYAGVFEYNIASMKVLEKNGFLKEGVFKKAVFKNGEICDEHRYYKLNPQKNISLY